MGLGLLFSGFLVFWRAISLSSPFTTRKRELFASGWQSGGDTLTDRAAFARARPSPGSPPSSASACWGARNEASALDQSGGPGDRRGAVSLEEKPKKVVRRGAVSLEEKPKKVVKSEAQSTAPSPAKKEKEVESWHSFLPISPGHSFQ